MLTIDDYLMGRGKRYAADLTEDVQANALDLLSRVNLLLGFAYANGVQPTLDEKTGTHVASGWRPPAINDATSNAAKSSRHMTGQAIDLRDDPDKRPLARWCLGNLDRLATIGLWMESPQWTPSWVHLQTVPPKSGKRVYIPSSKPPLAPPLPGQMVTVG